MYKDQFIKISFETLILRIKYFSFTFETVASNSYERFRRGFQSNHLVVLHSTQLLKVLRK